MKEFERQSIVNVAPFLFAWTHGVLRLGTVDDDEVHVASRGNSRHGSQIASAFLENQIRLKMEMECKCWLGVEGCVDFFERRKIKTAWCFLRINRCGG